MGILVQFAIQLALGALLLKVSIRVVDGFNPKNTYAAALGWSFLLALAGLNPLGAILGLVVFFMVCFRYYELGVLQAIGVILVQLVLGVCLLLFLAALLATLGIVAGV